MVKYHCVVFFLLAVIMLTIVGTMARNAPDQQTIATENTVPLSKYDAAGAGDKKNVDTFGGIGGYSGIGNNGLPFGGVGAGVGSLGSALGGGFGGFTGFGPGGGIGGVPGGAAVPVPP